MTKKEMIMKIIKAIVAILFALATMIICIVDTDYAPISHVLMIVASWIFLAFLVYKIDWKNN